MLDLFEDDSGTIWAGTAHGLLRLLENGGDVQFEYLSLGEKVEEQLDITAISQASPGVLWVATETGLFRRYADGRAELWRRPCSGES